MATPVRAVLFDVTGTLIEPCEDIGATYARLASRHGVEIPRERLAEQFPGALREWPERFFPGLSAPQRAAAERDRWREIVRQTLGAAGAPTDWPAFDRFFDETFAFFGKKEAWQILPGALAGLQAARRNGLRTAAVSNFDHRLPVLLQDIGIIDFFETIVQPVDCGYGKPEPEIFHIALERLESPAQASLFVGHDPIRDLAAAQSIGLQTVDVSGAHHTLPAQIDRLAKMGS